MKAADDKLAQMFNATDPDLKRFKDRGGKLILYHGWSDAAIPAEEYHQLLPERRLPRWARKDTGAFVRLYMVPGMQHCGGGPGPDSFGQFTVAQGDAQHDMATDIENWVEKGTVPQEIIATKYKDPANPASGALRTRPLCPYPQVARWKGSGSTDEAANFTCAVAEHGSR